MSGEPTLYNLYFQVYTLHHIKIKLTSSKATTLYNLYFQVYTLHHIKIKLTSSKAT